MDFIKHLNISGRITLTMYYLYDAQIFTMPIDYMVNGFYNDIVLTTWSTLKRRLIAVKEIVCRTN